MKRENDQPRYREAISIGWSLLWRTVGSFLVLLFLANLMLLAMLPELTRAGPSLVALVLPLVIATLVTALFIMPLIVRAMIAKPFSGFRLTLVRTPDAETRFHSTEPLARRSGHETESGNRDSHHGAHIESPGESRAAG